MGRNLRTCAWCYKPTSMPEVFAADTPLLEWFEDRIDTYCKTNNIDRKILWGAESDWNKVDIPEDLEAELLTYDELVSSVSRKVICSPCLKQDNKLWIKYYNKDFDSDDDLEIKIEDLS
tara:strand:- start:1455 stop:1811 length:357 start_codon:yes stop_codon:yes gene_type:complete